MQQIINDVLNQNLMSGDWSTNPFSVSDLSVHRSVGLAVIFSEVIFLVLEKEKHSHFTAFCSPLFLSSGVSDLQPPSQLLLYSPSETSRSQTT